MLLKNISNIIIKFVHSSIQKGTKNELMINHINIIIEKKMEKKIREHIYF